MTNAAELDIRIVAQDQASKVMKDLGKEASGLGKTLGDVGKIASGFLAANVVSGGVQKLTGFIGDSVAAAKESMAVNAQLEAVLKSTGGAAGVTADAVRDQAAALEKLSLFEDEAIINGQNLLLTFTNIGKDIFPEATRTMLDMSQALGQDLKSSSVQLGKALNDPIQGITALSRVGVTFTEQQKELIKGFVEAGDMARAQGVIIQELGKEFGGSAQAASDAAGASEVYKDRMNDLKEQIGEKIIPIQEKWLEVQAAVVTLIAEKVIPKLEELYERHWPAIQKAIQDVVTVVETVWPKVEPIIVLAIDNVIARIEGLIGQFQGMAQVIEGVVDLVVDLFHGRWGQAWEDMKSIAEGAINFFTSTLQTAFGNLPGIVVDGVKSAINAGIDQINNFLNSISGREIIPAIKDPLFGETITPGVNLPSLPNVPRLASGLAYVPHDMLAYLHRGERVVPASANRDLGGIHIHGDVVIQDPRASTGAVGDLGFSIVQAMRARGAA